MATHRKFRAGLIGCGSISARYVALAAGSVSVEFVACTSRSAERTAAFASHHGLEACRMEDMLANPDIDLVVNLTPPTEHFETTLRAMQAGKHVYAEKPLAATYEGGRELVEWSERLGTRLGCAPDTWLGAAHQGARRILDRGAIGAVVGGAIAFASRGMEAWHPNPQFFFSAGGGPLLDIGPYYVTQAVNLLGPVRSVWARGGIGIAERVVGSGPDKGKPIDLAVDTTVNGLLTFASGLEIPITASWDVWKHGRSPIEIYGTEGTLINPDPVHFNGDVLVSHRDGDWTKAETGDLPFGPPNHVTPAGATVADYRGIGMLDMVDAIVAGRPHHASAELALHVLEVLEGLGRSNGTDVAMTTTCERPPLLDLRP